LLKKHLVYQEKLVATNNEWQETCDQLLNENQSLKDDHEKFDRDMKSQNKKLTDQLNELKMEHYRIQKDNEESTAKLKNELSNSLNAHYLKNVLTSYFTTNDTTV
jgi:hypothetical protein